MFLPCFCLLILSLPLFGLSPGFCVWLLGSWISFLNSFFFLGWLFWVGGISKYGWCLAGGRGCWLKSPHQIPSVSWSFQHSLHIYQFVSFVSGIPCPLCCYYIWWGDGIGGWVVNLYEGVDGGQGVGIILYFLFLSCPFLFSCLAFSVPLFRWLEHDGCYICFFDFSFFFLTRSYSCREIVGVCCVKLF